MRIFRSARIERGLKTALVMAAVIVALLVLQRIPFIARVSNTLKHALVAVGTGAGNIVTRITTPEDSLHAQLATCEERLRDASTREAVLMDAEQRARELETLLGYMQSTQADGIVARITSRTLPEVAAVRIDKGQRDGVVKGDAVVVDSGHLFGEVVEVGDTWSTVRLVHNRESKIPAMLLGRTRTIGLVSGQEGSLFHMGFIPQDAVVEVGTIVVTSGLEGLLPPNLVIGVVTSVINEETSPFLEALIEPLYESREWTTVYVLSRGL